MNGLRKKEHKLKYFFFKQGIGITEKKAKKQEGIAGVVM